MRYLFFSAVAAAVLSSCGVDSKSLGGHFVLYRDEATMQFTAIGLDLSVGGTQGLIDGKIRQYGYDDRYVVAELEGDQFFYFDKAAVYDFCEKPVPPGSRDLKSIVQGPVNAADFEKAVKVLRLPPLSHSAN